MLSQRFGQSWKTARLLLLFSQRNMNKGLVSVLAPRMPAQLFSTSAFYSNIKTSVSVQQGRSCSSRMLQPQCTFHVRVQRAKSSDSCHRGDTVEEEVYCAGSSVQNSRDGLSPLPKLPVPDLKQTMDKYLTILSTVVSQQELDTTTQHVQQFIKPGGWGHKLQQYLIKRQMETDNWATDWWLHNMYLDGRLPLPVYCNPSLVGPTQHFRNREDYLRFTSKFVHGALDYKSMIDRGTLPVEVVGKKKTPLSMEQHYKLFSSYRRPGIPSDLLLTDLGTQEPAYMVVACRNQFYRVDVEQDGVTLSESELYSQLCKVLRAAESNSARSPPVGVLTTMDRPSWTKVRDKLATDSSNLYNLNVIENSAFILCLDKPTRSPMTGKDDITVQALNSLHGQGTDCNTCNRWFDKTCQLQVAEDGVFGMNGEHASGEGAPFFSLFEHAYFNSSRQNYEFTSELETRHLTDPEWLEWTVSPELLSDTARAQAEINKIIQNVDMCLAQFDEFGHNFANSQGISPDAFVQLAIQWAYYRLYGRMVMAYETASLRRFRQGRVDNIRVNSPAALAWLRAMCGELHVSEAQKHILFRAAVAWHQKYQKEILGVAPPLFAAYGPATADGYGVPYRVLADSMTFTVTSFHHCPHTDSHKFMDSLVSSLLELRDFCLQKR